MIYEEVRPWGKFEVLAEGENYKVKRITVDPLQRTSLQKHLKRTELWNIVEGKGQSTFRYFTDGIGSHDDETFIVCDGQFLEIHEQEIHRIENISATDPLVFIEIQYGDCDENDIIRYEDDYERITK